MGLMTLKPGDFVLVTQAAPARSRLGQIHRHNPTRYSDGWDVDWVPMPPEHESRGGWQPTYALRLLPNYCPSCDSVGDCAKCRPAREAAAWKHAPSEAV